MPLLGPLVVLGLVMAIPAGLPVLGLLTVPAALLEGLMLRALELLTQLCQGLPWGWVPLGGAFGLVVVLAVYALALGALRLRRQRGRAAAFGLAALLMLPLAAGLHAALNTGTVKLTVAGSGAQSSLVVTSGGQSVVLYRGSAGLPAAERILKQERAGDCLLFVDLRKTAESAGYRDRLEPRRVLLVQEELMGRLVEQPLPGVELYLAKQGGGTIACVEVAGYKVGIGSGRLDLSGYAPLDVLVAGSSAVTGSYETLLAGATAPEWAAPAGETIHNDGEAQIWIRPGKSVRIREVNHGDG